MKRFADFAPGPTTAEWYRGVYEKLQERVKELERLVATQPALAGGVGPFAISASASA